MYGGIRGFIPLPRFYQADRGAAVFGIPFSVPACGRSVKKILHVFHDPLEEI